MRYPFKITINDQQQADQIKDDVQIGHYFVFVKHKKATSVERLKRLLVTKYTKNNVIPLVNQPVKLEDVTITPEHRDIEPIGCVVTDSEIYRAKQDNVRLFIAFPTPPDELRLTINCNSEVFTERPVKLTDGIGIETISVLPPGHYEAQLSTAGRRICIPASFTVAEERLAPLSAQLIKHKLKEDAATFLFELVVESYQMPFEGKLMVTLIEQGLEIADTIAKPVSPGRYVGRIPMSGTGPFCLRVMVSNDAKRVAEVAIPSGPQVLEEKASVISELGQEKCFSMVPEADALPLRSGYLTEGDFFAAPLTVEEIVTNNRLIQVNTDVESLVLVNLDLTSGNYVIQKEGNVAAGNTITVRTNSPFCTVFVGGFVNDEAFEGYTTFIKPLPFQLSVEAPDTIRARTDLVVRLSCSGISDKTIPVLLCVRDDERIMDKPEVSLGAAAKRGIDTATKGMDERAFSTMAELLDKFFEDDSSPYQVVTSHSTDNDDLIDVNAELNELNIHAKFDLAQWFLDMGDTDTAHNILTESLAKGNIAQKHRAEEMLRAISVDDTKHSAIAVAKEFSLPIVDIESLELNPDVINMVDQMLLTKHKTFPLFKRGDCLFVAISDPTDLSTLIDDIQSHTQMQIEPILAEADKLESFIKRALEFDLSLYGETGEEEKLEEGVTNDSDDFAEDELDSYLETFTQGEETFIEEALSSEESPEDELSADEELSLYLETFSEDDGVSEDDLNLDESEEEDFSTLLDDLSSGDSSDEVFSLDEESKSEPSIQEKSPQEEAEAIVEAQQSEFTTVLYYQIVQVSGRADVVIPLGDSQGGFTVETFAMTEGDWTQNHTSVIVTQPVRVDLNLPPVVHPDDKVIGHLSAITSSRKAVIFLTHNGQTVALRNGKPIEAISSKTPVDLEFYVQPGTYIAKIEDSSTGETDSIEVVVGELGQFKFYPKELGLLLKDESINRETGSVLSMRVLQTLDAVFNRLITATANDSHQGCEPTAAKILAAIFMYLTAENDDQRSTAEQMILMGVAHEQKMIRPGLGFAIYPERNEISEFLSKSTVRYLWNLKLLDEISDISKPLRKAVRQGLSLADRAAQAHHMQHLPEQIESIEEAYTIAAAGIHTDAEAVFPFIENLIDFSGTMPSLKKSKSQNAVADRTKLAYAAAGLIAMGDLERGLKLANQVMRQFNEQGRLYSTMDSVAAIVLMIQLRMSGIVISEARVRVNGQEMTASEAAHGHEPIESIEVLEGIAAVEVTRSHEENWADCASHFPVNIDFINARGMTVQQFAAGERVELVVSLPDGYQAGDMVEVVLPCSLSSIQGGGKVKQLSLDFEGKNELRIPLVVTSQIEDQQHFALCVRNMFEQERAASSGILGIVGRPQA